MPDAQVQVQDLTGGGDHYQVSVVSSQFEGRDWCNSISSSTVQQAMSSEAIHALALKLTLPSLAGSESSGLSKIPVPSHDDTYESKMEKNYDSRTERAN